jgi:hypothetical protein
VPVAVRAGARGAPAPGRELSSIRATASKEREKQVCSTSAAADADPAEPQASSLPAVLTGHDEPASLSQLPGPRQTVYARTLPRTDLVVEVLAASPEEELVRDLKAALVDAPAGPHKLHR